MSVMHWPFCPAFISCCYQHVFYFVQINMDGSVQTFTFTYISQFSPYVPIAALCDKDNGVRKNVLNVFYAAAPWLGVELHVYKSSLQRTRASDAPRYAITAPHPTGRKRGKESKEDDAVSCLRFDHSATLCALYLLLCPHLGGIMRWSVSVVRPSVRPSVLLSVAYIGSNSKTKRPRKTKLCTGIPQVTCDSHADFKVKRSKVKVTGRRHIVASTKRAATWRTAADITSLKYYLILQCL